MNEALAGPIAQVCLGGMFAIQVIRLVLERLPGIIGGKNGGKKSGDMDPAFWQLEMREAVREGMSSTITPILERQTEILSDIKELQKELTRKL